MSTPKVISDSDIEEILGTLSERELRILMELSDGELVHSMDDTCCNAEVPIKDGKRIIRRLHSDGLAYKGTLVSDDYLRCVSGYWRSTLGDHVLKAAGLKGRRTYY